MALGEMRRLRRGLKDVSPLFEEKGPVHQPAPPGDHRFPVEIFSVFSGSHADDSLFLNAFLASEIDPQDKNISLVSLEPPHLKSALHGHGGQDQDLQEEEESCGSGLKRFVITTEQWESLLKRPVSRDPAALARPQIIFLDVDRESLPASSFEKAISILDKWIFLVRPSLESLTETYKWMKRSQRINREMEYYILFDGHPEDMKGSVLFEKFSSMAARHLGIHLLWLGYLDITRSSQYIAADLSLEPLFFRTRQKMNSPEKLALAEYIAALSFRPQAHFL